MTDDAQSLEKLDKNQLLSLLKKQQGQLRAQDKKLAVQDKKLAVQDKKLAFQHQHIAYLEEQMRLMTCRQYGQRSERQSEDPQADLFNEAEVLVAEDATAEATPQLVKAHTRRTSGRRKLPENLPRQEIEHDLPEADKTCACGCQKRRIGTDVSENLEYIPAKLYVERHLRHRYACPQCEEGVQIAARPVRLIPKSNVGPHLLAFIITAKYQDSLPLYRLSKIFERFGLEITRHTLARWVIQCSDALAPLMDLMEAQLRQAPVILMDETTLQVNKETGKAASSPSYMWIRRGLAPPDEDPPRGRDITLYHYSPTRSGQVAVDLLSGYRGALMTDGYAGYHDAVNRYQLQHATCWAHARRKFVDAEKALPKGKKSPAITAILNLIGQLYAIEKRLQQSCAEERQRTRQQAARPVLDKLKANLDKKLQQVTPKSKLGEAIAYTLKYWPTLNTYLDNGHLPIDNNGAENGIRPFVVGRKNWLFADTANGAQASARLYSLIETAKANGHEPYHYLSRLFQQLPGTTSDVERESLLPWNMKIQTTPL